MEQNPMQTYGFNESIKNFLPTSLRQRETIFDNSTSLSQTVIPSLMRTINATLSSSSQTTHSFSSAGTRASKTGISFTSTVIVTCFLCVVIIMTVFGNSIAIAAFFVSRELRKITYYFIINLCISDLTVALLSMPFWISYVLTGWPDNKSGAVYTFWLCLDIFCGSWSIMNLAMISIERYVCIVYPLHYSFIVTKRRAFAMVAFVLLYSTLASILGFLQSLSIAKRMSISIFVAVYVVPVLIKIYTYACIYKEAKTQKKLIGIKETKRWKKDKRFVSSEKIMDKESPEYSEILSTKNPESPQSTDVNSNARTEKTETRQHQKYKSSLEISEKQKCRRSKVKILRKKRNRRSKSSTNGNHAASGILLSNSPHAKSTATQNKMAHEAFEMEGICYESEESKPGDQVSLVSELSKDCSDNGTSYDTRSHPTRSDPTRSHPTQSDPTQSDPTQSDPTQSDPTPVETTLTTELPSYTIAETQLSTHCADQSQSVQESQHVCSRDADGCKQKKRLRSSSSQSKSIRFFKSDSLAKIKSKSILRFRRFQTELREAKVIGLIIGTFLVLWTPFMLVVVLSSLGVSVSMDMVISAKCLHYANSAINPILYVLLNRIFRKSVRKVLRKAGILERRNRADYF